MCTAKMVRNVLGTACILFAGYVFFASLKDARRYMKISTM